MQLALGTVQFGLNYGVANQTGQVTEQAMQQIFNHAWQHQIHVLDTAHQYGDAEARIGKYYQQHPDQRFQIVTKLTGNTAQDLQKHFSLSLQRLQQRQVHGLLLHHVDDLRQPHQQTLWQQLQTFKSQQQVLKIGASVYHPGDVDFLLNNFDIDIIQVPLNIFDQRLIDQGQLTRLQQRNVEIHVRSVFLQGLLLMPLAQAKLKRPPACAALDQFHQFCAQQQITPLAACLQFIQHCPAIAQVVVGAQSLTQLQEIQTAWQLSQTTTSVDFSWCSQSDLAIIDPSCWT